MRVYQLLGCIVPIVVALTQSAARADEARWEVVAVGSGKLAVPKSWRNLDGIQPRLVIYRQGDGIGVPRVDETDSPLQIGLIVEKLPASKESVKEIMDRLAEQAKKVPRLELVGKESIEDLKLVDGVAAKVLTAEFIKEGSRRSLQMKLVVKDADGTAWIVSGHLVGGKDSKWPKPDSKYAKWLRAHLTSLSLDAEKFAKDRIEAAYAEVAK